MIIRQAKIEHATASADCLFLAMEDIAYQLCGESDANKAKSFLKHFVVLENNQYSYQNCWVITADEKVIGAMNVYDGAQLTELREPILSFIKANQERSFFMENETESGEFYIDCIGINTDQQGKGIGSKALNFLIDEYLVKNNQTLGLLVDEENPNAKRLYIKLGFKVVGNKTLAG
ncbi:MAG: N-acetyltransferase [Chitinophagaceae bacterium]|nr:MAG: N-acetyltransferase [Chitinophagaceae bacterium]